MSIIRFNDDKEPHAYVVQCHNQEARHINVNRISGDIDTWSGETYTDEAQAYLNAYVWLRKQQADELHEFELEMAYKGIEGFPSNNAVFEKRYPFLAKQYYKLRAAAIQRGLKERSK